MLVISIPEAAEDCEKIRVLLIQGAVWFVCLFVCCSVWLVVGCFVVFLLRWGRALCKLNMLSFSVGVTRLDKIRKERIRGNVQVDRARDKV